MAEKNRLEQQARRKKKENLEDKVGDAIVKNLFAKKKMKASLGKEDKNLFSQLPRNYKEDFKELVILEEKFLQLKEWLKVDLLKRKKVLIKLFVAKVAK